MYQRLLLACQITILSLWTNTSCIKGGNRPIWIIKLSCSLRMSGERIMTVGMWVQVTGRDFQKNLFRHDFTYLFCPFLIQFSLYEHRHDGWHSSSHPDSMKLRGAPCGYWSTNLEGPQSLTAAGSCHITPVPIPQYILCERKIKP